MMGWIRKNKLIVALAVTGALAGAGVAIDPSVIVALLGALAGG